MRPALCASACVAAFEPMEVNPDYQGPLFGYRILDLTQMVSGPMGTQILGDQVCLRCEPLRLPIARRSGHTSSWPVAHLSVQVGWGPTSGDQILGLTNSAGRLASSSSWLAAGPAGIWAIYRF